MKKHLDDNTCYYKKPHNKNDSLHLIKDARGNPIILEYDESRQNFKELREQLKEVYNYLKNTDALLFETAFKYKILNTFNPDGPEYITKNVKLIICKRSNPENLRPSSVTHHKSGERALICLAYYAMKDIRTFITEFGHELGHVIFRDRFSNGFVGKNTIYVDANTYRKFDNSFKKLSYSLSELSAEAFAISILGSLQWYIVNSINLEKYIRKESHLPKDAQFDELHQYRNIMTHHKTLENIKERFFLTRKERSQDLFTVNQVLLE